MVSGQDGQSRYMMQSWQLKDTKARFIGLMRIATTLTQTNTIHWRNTAVVFSMQDCNHLNHPKALLAEYIPSYA